MSRLTKLAASLLVVMLLLAQVATVHAVSFKAIPSINQKLYGTFESDDQGDKRLISLSTMDKDYLEYRGNPDLRINSIVCQLNAAGEIETYYIDTDDYIYVEDEQDHRMLNQLPCPLRRHTDYAAGPLDYQKSHGYVVGAYDRTLSLNSLQNGEEYGYIDLPLADYVEAITPKSLIGSVAEYYLLDTCGRIWTVSISFPSFQLVDLQEIVSDGVPVEYDPIGFYYDGMWLYRTYYFDRGSYLQLIDPNNGETYDLGMMEEGVTIWALYEVGTIPTVKDEDFPTVEIPLMGIHSGMHPDYFPLYSLRTHSHNYLEYRGDPNLTLHAAVTQLDANGAPQTYYIGTDGYVYTEDPLDHFFLVRGAALRALHSDYAAAPAYYQRTNGWSVALEDNNLYLTSLFTGDDADDYEPIVLWGCGDAIAITPRSFDRANAEYYILNSDGEIWSVTIRFPSFYITNMERVLDTGVYAGNNDGFYFDGTWIYRTHVFGDSSALTMINPETGKSYNLGSLGQGVVVRSLYEAGKIAALDHAWDFVNFEWERVSGGGYAAYAVFKCSLCDETRRVSATVQKIPGSIVTRYGAVVGPDQSLDGQVHSVVYIPFFDPSLKPWKYPIVGPIKPINPIPYEPFPGTPIAPKPFEPDPDWPIKPIYPITPINP